MKRNGLDKFAAQLLHRVVAGERDAYKELAEFVDILLVGLASHRLGAGDFAKLRANVILTVPKNAGRLKAAPRRALRWIQQQISAGYREQAGWIGADRDRAANLQRRMMPSQEFGAHGMEVAIGLRPFDILSGDFFDYSITDRDAIVAMGDAMGKGTAAALLASYTLGEFRALNSRIRDLGKLSERLNASLNHARGDGTEYAAGLFLRWQPNGRYLSVCNAGCDQPYLLRDGAISTLGPTGHPLGMFPNTKFEISRVKSRPGDILVLGSDGLSDQPQNSGELFHPQEVIGELDRKHVEPGARQLLEHYWRTFDDHTGEGVPLDDQTLVVVRFQ